MFKFFKEKIKSWVGKSKKNIEETKPEEEEKVEEAKVEEEKPKKEIKKKEKVEKKKEEKKPKKEKKKKEKKKKGKKETEKEVLDDISEEDEDIEEKIDKLEETMKEDSGKELPMKFEPGLQKYTPDTEQLEKEAKEQPVEPIAEEKPEPVEEEKEEIVETAEEIVKPVQRGAPTIEELEAERKPSIFKRLKEKFSYKVSEDDFERLFEDLELLLLENNVALEASDAIKASLKEELVGKEIKKIDLESEIQAALKKSIQNLLLDPDDIPSLVKEKQPFVMVFFGINGTGKTTTIAKVADMLKKNKISCVLAAADTFRAASIEQLQEHATNLKLKLIKHDYGADPAAVGFDAVKHAKAHGIQVVLIDTAGRMHTQDNLLSEMEKICRVTDPDLKIFVAESIAGNDAIQQAKSFNETIGIDGSILTKADVDEKGGTAISISHVTKKPILFLGTGQEYKDLEVFNPEKFIKDLGL